MSLSLKRLLIALLLVVALVAVGCGSGDSTEITSSEGSPADGGIGGSLKGDDPVPAALEGGIAQGAAGDDPIPAEPDGGIAQGAAGDDPIPVEPDGGIGDGAEPLPGARDEMADEGTWHGAQVAETNCPGVEFKRVQASNFSFSVPVDFADNGVQGVDSEVGVFTGGNKMEVSFDYGWYSSDSSEMPGAEVEPIDYSGIVGKQIIVRDAPGKFVGVFFAEVKLDQGFWDLLNLDVRFTDINDEIIARCIVGSIEWA